ncbi:MAG: hypothetical protein WBQ60_08480 [Asticcacaulis sp.]
MSPAHDRQYQRAEGLTNLVGYDLRMMDGSQNASHQDKRTGDNACRAEIGDLDKNCKESGHWQN